LLIGLGEVGQRILAAVEEEGAARGEEVHRYARFLQPTLDEPGIATLRAQLATELPRLLDLSVQAAIGVEQAGWTPPLDLFVVLQLGPPEVSRAACAAALGQLLGLLDEAARGCGRPLAAEAGQRVFVSLILLLTPDPAAGPEAPPFAELSPVVAEVLAREATRRDGRLPIAGCYLLEPTTGRFGLEQAEREGMVRSFLRFMLYSSLRRQVTSLYQGGRGGEPFGSFLVGSAEFPGGLVGRYLVERTQLVALRAFTASGRSSSEEEAREEGQYARDLREALESLPLGEGEAGFARFLEPILERQRAKLAPRQPPAGLLEGPTSLLQRYGEDFHEAIVRDLRPGENEQVALGATLAGVVADASREGGRRAARAWGRAQRQVDGWLAARPEQHHLDVLRVVAGARRQLAAQGEDHRQQANRPVDPGPDPAVFSSAYLRFRAAVLQKPEPRPMALLGAAVGFFCWWLAADLLAAAAGTTLAGVEAWLRFGGLALLLTVLVIGGGLLGLSWLRQRPIRAALGDRPGDARGSLFAPLERLIDGDQGSLRRYFGDRCARAGSWWRARFFASLDRQLAAEEELFDQARRALAVQVRDLEEGLERRGVLDPGQPHEDVARLLPPASTLTVPLPAAPEQLLVLARRNEQQLVGSSPVALVKQVLDPYRLLRTQLPFGDLEPLRRRLRPELFPRSLLALLQDPQQGPPAWEAVHGLLQRCAALRQSAEGPAAGTRLPLPLQLEDAAWHGAGLGEVPCLLGHPDLLDLLRDRYPDAAALASRRGRPGPTAPPERGIRELLQHTREMGDPDRLLVVQLLCGLAPAAVPWLARLVESAAPGAAPRPALLATGAATSPTPALPDPPGEGS